ncbi:hypothetical protein FM106_12030 [Brachybacterium faecium]|nr:hypothetical protein FM106_12030 [Brachybacterium faecium]
MTGCASFLSFSLFAEYVLRTNISMLKLSSRVDMRKGE